MKRSTELGRTPPSKRDLERRARLMRRAQVASPRTPQGLLPKDGVPRAFFPERRAMRSADRQPEIAPSGPLATEKRPATKNVPAPPSAAVIAHTRLGYGPSPGDVEAFDALGATDAARLEAWIDQQLDPSSIDDSAADARIAQAGYITLGKSLAQLWQEHALAEEWDDHMRPFWETQRATFLRAIHSRRQLLEVMCDFWHNHFSIFADEFLIGPVWVHNDRDAIRGHALGNFRDMLEAVTRTPAMLYYLDNAFNTSEDANENFARELMELHTLGADVYLGSMPPEQVPVDDNGVPEGYTEADVIAAARCLTGWTFDSEWVYWLFGQTGEFLYYDDWHDHEAKTVLGLDLPADQAAMKDGRDLLDRLAQHPATGVHLATKLCRRLLGDFPPQSVIDAAAAVFTAQHAAPDQIAQVIRTIVLSPEFLTAWGDKVKRPFEIAISGFRGAGGDIPFTLDDDMSNWFMWVYYQTGQALFSWHPPNGYPDIKAAWNTTSPRVMTWRLGNFFVQAWNEDTETYYFDLLGQTPAGVRSAQALVDFWGQRILGRPLPTGESEKLVAFMAQGENPLNDLPLDSEWQVQERLRALVALILMSPSFLWR